MHTRTVNIRKNSPLASYFYMLTTETKNLRNVANFYIRNTMTGIIKSPEYRTANETEVLHFVFTGIQKANEHADARFRKTVSDAYRSALPALVRHALVIEKAMKIKRLSYPTKKNRMLNYYQLDAVLKFSKNRDYYALPSQVNQQALKKTVESWNGYFASLRTWKEDPSAFNGKPRIPGYLKAKQSTARIPSQRLKDTVENGRRVIHFPGCEETLAIGNSGFTDPVAVIEVMPFYGGYRICIVCGKKDEDAVPERPEHPERILGIDPGIDNFLTCTSNCGLKPLIIDGEWLKSENQGFNKRKAVLTSKLTKGSDSIHSTKESKRLLSLYRKRKDTFDDFFYKTAHYICRVCVNAGIEVIVAGHNSDQKQEINTGHVNNQNFVSIPYQRMYDILVCVAAKYGIPVIIREESYTSKASLIDGDDIPTYKKGDDTPHVFSGRRVKRGLYRSKNGIELNSDVNGSGNIIRKEYPYAFDNVKDWSYLTKTVVRVTRNDICHSATKECKKAPRRGSDLHAVMRREHRERLCFYRYLFQDMTYNKKKPQEYKISVPVA